MAANNKKVNQFNESNSQAHSSPFKNVLANNHCILRVQRKHCKQTQNSKRQPYYGCCLFTNIRLSANQVWLSCDYYYSSIFRWFIYTNQKLQQECWKIISLFNRSISDVDHFCILTHSDERALFWQNGMIWETLHQTWLGLMNKSLYVTSRNGYFLENLFHDLDKESFVHFSLVWFSGEARNPQEGGPRWNRVNLYSVPPLKLH